jgi:hypothetical protein
VYLHLEDSSDRRKVILVEERVRVLEMDQAVIKNQIASLIAAVEANTAAQREIAAIMNRTKGAWAVILTLGVIITFVVDVILRLTGYGSK